MSPDTGGTATLHHKAGKDVDEGRLARTIRPQQREGRASRNLQADTFQRFLALAAMALVGLAQILGDNGVIRRAIGRRA